MKREEKAQMDRNVAFVHFSLFLPPVPPLKNDQQSEETEEENFLAEKRQWRIPVSSGGGDWRC